MFVAFPAKQVIRPQCQVGNSTAKFKARIETVHLDQMVCGEF